MNLKVEGCLKAPKSKRLIDGRLLSGFNLKGKEKFVENLLLTGRWLPALQRMAKDIWQKMYRACLMV
jgi:hypothetical protein